MSYVDYCFKIEKVVAIKNGECDFDKQHKCPNKGSVLCLLRMIEEPLETEKKQLLQDKQKEWILKLKNGITIKASLSKPITLNELLDELEIPISKIDEAI